MQATEFQLEHPRPQLIRPRRVGCKGYLSLNGKWDFAFDDDDAGESKGWHLSGWDGHKAINIPFAYQTELSGVNDTDTHAIVWYRRKVPIRDIAHLNVTKVPERTLLHFGAVDYEAWVWVNGQQVAHHIGGHVGFTADITSALQSQEQEATIAVKVRDAPEDLSQPRGKQYWKTDEHGKAAPESIFYTPTTGIWQTVWIEAVPDLYISNVQITPDIDSGSIQIDVDFQGTLTDLEDILVEGDVKFGEIFIANSAGNVSAENGSASLTLGIRNPGRHPPTALRESMYTQGVLPPEVNRDAWDNGLALWSPEHPRLYSLEIIVTRGSRSVAVDNLDTYFGMRKISINESGKLCLNNRVYFQKLLLDQGYWLKSGLTAPEEKAFEVDITKAKELGFNGVRKHQKVEDPRFLFHADRLGFLVWGEMANAYEYSTKYVQRFISEWTEVIQRDYSHPCIVAWTPINESWGVPALNTSPQQRAHLAALYYHTKSLDPTRPVIDNDGWQHVKTDLITIHDYRGGDALRQAYSSKSEALKEKVVGYPILVGQESSSNLPILCTEYGGLAIKGGAEGWGYSQAKDEASFLQSFEDLTRALVAGGVVQGLCYTQLADVEQEVNGLLTADRRHKLDPAKVKAILDSIKPL